ncbi:TAM domain-containingmethyltransferase [Purpureocillium lavendulum]|uniref:TAM domain-containingmethyltransferase n=1 Tax=Purpureocillium lavendulum TaxID=1247861 RepID=A0AB34FWW3_9HYPO|nr:TAM domain-containingmethyltransferase [Purpureocillium lavendulum]
MAGSPGSGSNDGGGQGESGLHGYQFTFQSPDQSEGISVDGSAPGTFSTLTLTGAPAYAFPNDAPEQERLALQADILMKLFGDRLYFAPLSDRSPPRTVLDVATGLGDWAVQMGDRFPDSEIIGTDLSPIQPEQVPPNVNFYVEDSADLWEYSQKFDYIHTRVTAGCWSSFEKQVAQQAFDCLAPGGWFESQEIDSTVACDDGTLHPESAMAKWFDEITAAGEIISRSTVIGASLKEVYERVGFVDVQQRIFKIPINGWAKDKELKKLGQMWENNLVSGLSGFSYRLFNGVYGRSSAEIEVKAPDHV